MTSAIMQPTLFPWMGYFDMIDTVNVFVFLDNVQLARRSWQVRNRIKTAQGEFYLTVPLSKETSRDETLISQAFICNEQPWRAKHLETIRHAYGKTPYFAEVFPFLQTIYEAPISSIAEFNIHFISAICKKIGISTLLVRASELDGINSKKDSLLANICKRLKCEEYLSAPGSANYINEHSPGGSFVPNGINLYYHHYNHPQYPQKHNDFMPYMCVLDLLFNVGFQNALSVIRNGREMPIFYTNYILKETA
jgi:hypothetical protein